MYDKRREYLFSFRNMDMVISMANFDFCTENLESQSLCPKYSQRVRDQL